MDKRRQPRLSLDLLRGFRVAARHLSFTRAAQELHVTQSAISREIKTLEEQIGKPLFRRVHRALQLTRAGEELFRATDEALALIDAAAGRVAESGKTLAVTTTTALASLWLAPRLPRFNRLHPGIDVRIVATNERPDLEREQLDVAIRFVGRGADIPEGERLTDCEIFPVCSPELARDKMNPLGSPADLAKHVRLDFETIRDGRPWSEWDVWYGALKIPPVTPASTLRFSHYDQVIPAAIEGSGVAMGARPHLTHHLRDGTLCAPFGPEAAAILGNFFIVLRPNFAPSDATEAFVAWLKSEVRRDGEVTLAVPRNLNRPPSRRVHASGGPRPPARASGRRH
jgi:LysR family transcriptional regulator, glycine cleavage system transcriptional activator